MTLSYKEGKSLTLWALDVLRLRLPGKDSDQLPEESTSVLRLTRIPPKRVWPGRLSPRSALSSPFKGVLMLCIAIFRRSTQSAGRSTSSTAEAETSGGFPTISNVLPYRSR